MPFFVLRFSSDHHGVVEELKHTLAHIPNGTPLSCGKVVYTPATRNLWVYWLEEEFSTIERMDRVRSIEGVAKFEKLTNITVSIHDPCWVWEDAYIDSVFEEVVVQSYT